MEETHRFPLSTPALHGDDLSPIWTRRRPEPDLDQAPSTEEGGGGATLRERKRKRRRRRLRRLGGRPRWARGSRRLGGEREEAAEVLREKAARDLRAREEEVSEGKGRGEDAGRGARDLIPSLVATVTLQ